LPYEINVFFCSVSIEDSAPFILDNVFNLLKTYFFPFILARTLASFAFFLFVSFHYIFQKLTEEGKT